MCEPITQLDDKCKVEVLQALLEENNKQLIFWRQRNWIAFRDTAGGLIAIAGIVRFLPEVKKELTIVVFALTILASIYLCKNFSRYQERRNDGARVEEALSLYKVGVYLSSKSLFPDSYRTPKADILGTYSFIAAIWVIAFAILYFLFK